MKKFRRQELDFVKFHQPATWFIESFCGLNEQE